MSTAYPQHIHIVLFTTTLHSKLALLFIYAFLFTMWYFSTITAQLTLQQCLQHILNIYIRYCLQLHYPVYWLCCLYMLPLHNVTFFHNHCTIDSTTMSTAYPQHIHIVLVTTTLHSILALLFIYASFTQCDIFSQLLHNWLYNNVYSISSTYTCGTVTITLSSILTVLFTFTFTFTMWIFFHSYYIIVYSTMFAVRLHWILKVLFTITLPSILSVLFTYAVLFTMWYFCTITAQFTLQQCLQHIFNIYIQYYLQLHYPVYCMCFFTYSSFSQCDIFSQSLPNSLYNNVYGISSTYTYNTVYNYTIQYTNCALYIYILSLPQW